MSRTNLHVLAAQQVSFAIAAALSGCYVLAVALVATSAMWIVIDRIERRTNQ